jgi:hypothetical protein
MPPNDSTEVEECSWHGRGWYSSVRRALVWWQGGAVHLDSNSRATPVWHGDLHPRTGTHAPQSSRRTMTQNRPRPAREHSRHPASVLGQEAVADRVDAAVYLAQALELQPVRDRAAIEPKL